VFQKLAQRLQKVQQAAAEKEETQKTSPTPKRSCVEEGEFGEDGLLVSGRRVFDDGTYQYVGDRLSKREWEECIIRFSSKEWKDRIDNQWSKQ